MSGKAPRFAAVPERRTIFVKGPFAEKPIQLYCNEETYEDALKILKANRH
jgi:hypothetical protein